MAKNEAKTELLNLLGFRYGYKFLKYRTPPQTGVLVVV